MKSILLASFLFLLAEYSFAEELINYTITSDSQTNTLEGDLRAKGNVVIKSSNGNFEAYSDKLSYDKDGKFLKVFTNTSDKLPSPGPSSTKLKILGFPKVSQVEIIHIAIISENKFDIVGDVTKSPFFPKGILFV